MPDFIYENFEWDANKDAINKAKHGIGFEDAIEIFSAKIFETSLPYKTIYGIEERILVVGKLGGVFITVIYTIRGSRKRIISARRSRKQEVISYEND